MTFGRGNDLTIYRCDFEGCAQRYALADRGAPESPWDWVEVRLTSTMADYRVRVALVHLCGKHANELVPMLSKLEWKTSRGEIVPGPGDEDRCRGRMPGCVLRLEHAGTCDRGQHNPVGMVFCGDKLVPGTACMLREGHEGTHSPIATEPPDVARRCQEKVLLPMPCLLLPGHGAAGFHVDNPLRPTWTWP